MTRKFIFRRPLGDKTPGTLIEIHVVSSQPNGEIRYLDYERLIQILRDRFPHAESQHLYLGITRGVRYDDALADGPLYQGAPIVIWRTASDRVPEEMRYDWNDFARGVPWYEWKLSQE